MSRPFQDIAGSAVIPATKAIIQPDWLLDELELRMTRCVPPASPALRIGNVLPAGESLHRIAATETRNWWVEMGLDDSDVRAHGIILDAMLERSPVYLGWATAPLLSGYMDEIRNLAVLLRVVEWVTASGDVERVVRDAVALGVVVPWFVREEATRVRDVLTAWVQSQNPATIRMGFVVAAAYVRDTMDVDRELQRAILDACWAHAPRVDTETAMAVGWTLRELLRQAPERVLPELLARVHELSRQAMRTAVEGLSRETRVRVTSQWQQRIHGDRGRTVTLGPSSTARTRCSGQG